MAGSSVVETFEQRGPIGVITLVCTGDDSDGSFPAKVLATKIDGFIRAIETNPGSTAPTDNYDIALDDAEGHDVLEGGGQNRDTANTEKASCVRGVGEFSEVAKSDVLTFKITGNSVNDATLVAKIYFEGSSEG